MPRPRTPLAAAIASGAYANHPGRFARRHEPRIADPIGEPPEWLSEGARDAWRDMAAGLPWLNRSHRCVVEIAATLRAKMQTGALGVPGMQLLRVTLGQLGATPADYGKVGWAPACDELDDLDD